MAMEDLSAWLVQYWVQYIDHGAVQYIRWTYEKKLRWHWKGRISYLSQSYNLKSFLLSCSSS